MLNLLQMRLKNVVGNWGFDSLSLLCGLRGRGSGGYGSS